MNLSEIKNHLNNIYVGISLGIISPIVSFLIMYNVRIKQQGFVTFMEQIIQVGLLSKLLSLAVLPNLGIFFIFIWLNYANSARGVLLSTIIMAVTVMIIYFAN